MRKNNLRELINNDVTKLLDEFHPFDIANEFLNLSALEQKQFVDRIDEKDCALIFSYIDDEKIEEIIEIIGHQKVAKIFSVMESDDAVDILTELDEENSESILEQMNVEKGNDISSLRNFDDATAGAFMNNSFIKVPNSIDVKQAMKILISFAPDVESINTIFVCDKDTLLGTIDLKKLITAKSPCLVDEIMNTHFQAIQANDDITIALKIIDDYDIYDLPVLDGDKMLGIITIDDAIEAIVEETSDDYFKFAGLISLPKDNETIIQATVKRFPWLAILLILDLFVATLSSSFDYLFNAPYNLTVLIIFQPIILSLSGNCGTQSLAIAVRNVSDNRLNSKMFFKSLLKELLSGIAIGFVLAVLTFGFSYLLLYLRKDFNNPLFSVSLVVSLSVFIAIVVANLVGSIVPIIFYKCKIDPAVASGPFITTINDLVSLLIYFSLAANLIASLL